MKNLALLRKEKGLTQLDMCSILGVSKPTYCHYETGRYEPDIKTLLKLADYFDCSIDYLLGHETKQLMHMDSLTENQQQAISMIKKLDDDEIILLLGYLARMTNTPLEEVLKNQSRR